MSHWPYLLQMFGSIAAKLPVHHSRKIGLICKARQSPRPFHAFHKAFKKRDETTAVAFPYAGSATAVYPKQLFYCKYNFSYIFPMV